MRDVEAVLPAEGEQEVVARDARDGVRLEPEQPADAVVLVHDVVARAQVGEGLQRAAAEAAFARHAAAEDLVVGQEDETEVAPDEAAPCRRDGEEELGLLREVVPRLEHARLDPAEEVTPGLPTAFISARNVAVANASGSDQPRLPNRLAPGASSVPGVS